MFQLIIEHELNPNLYAYLKKGKVYYSYLVQGTWGSIDTIYYDKRYAEVVEQFEKENNCFAYHVIEDGSVIILLFVSDDKEDWKYEQLADDTILAYYHDFESSELCEFGEVWLSSWMGALVRVA